MTDKEIIIEEIKKTEKEVGYKFPQSYTDFCINNREFPGYLFIVGKREKVIGEIFEQEVTRHLYKQDHNNLGDKCLPDDVFAIADTVDGSFICLDYKDNLLEPKVVYLEMDNAYGERDIAGDYEEWLEDYHINKKLSDFNSEKEIVETILRHNLEFVADSFEEFLSITYNEEEI